MKSLPQLFFGTKPMKLWEKVVATVLSAVYVPLSYSFLLAISIVMKTFVWGGIIIAVLGIVFSIYATWYLWVKIPDEE